LRETLAVSGLDLRLALATYAKESLSEEELADILIPVCAGGEYKPPGESS